MRKPVVAVLALLIVAVAGLGAWASTRDGEEQLCYSAQGFVVIDGDTVLAQSGGPHPDCATGPDRRPGELVLGTDCKVRDEDGTVTTEVAPTDPDGGC